MRKVLRNRTSIHVNCVTNHITAMRNAETNFSHLNYIYQREVSEKIKWNIVAQLQSTIDNILILIVGSTILLFTYFSHIFPCRSEVFDMRHKSVPLINFQTRYWEIHPDVSVTLTPSATNTTSTGIGTALKPSYTIIKVEEDCGGRSMFHLIYFQKKFSSMNWENML